MGYNFNHRTDGMRAHSSLNRISLEQCTAPPKEGCGADARSAVTQEWPDQWWQTTFAELYRARPPVPPGQVWP